MPLSRKCFFGNKPPLPQSQNNNKNSFLTPFPLQVLRAMQDELANSGLTPEEILAKTVLLQKAISGDNSPAFINKSLLNGLSAADLSPKDLAKVPTQPMLGTTRATPTAAPLVAISEGVKIWVALVALRFFFFQYFNTCSGVRTTHH